MSDIDLSNLLKKSGESGKREEKKDPKQDTVDRVRQKLDGQITEYTEGTDSQGIADVEALLAGDPDNPDLQDWLAFLYYTNNRLDQAIELYRKLLAKGHKVDTQYFYLGNAYYKKGLTQLAVEQWRRSLETGPNGPMARKAQARIHEVEGLKKK